MTPKQLLLDQLAKYDTSVLARLKKYADLIMLPEEDLLVNVTMSQMVEKSHALADIHFPEWTDRSKADFGEFVIELLGLFSEKDFYYLNAFANEGQLSGTTVYSNAYSKALIMGHAPVLHANARCKVRVVFAAGPQTFVQPGQIVLKSGAIEFSNTQPLVIPESAGPTTLVVDFAQGIYFALDEDFNGSSVRIIQKNTDISSIVLNVDGIPWERQLSTARSSATDKHFVVLPEEDATCEIIFGEDGYGLRPGVGAKITGLFRTGMGTDSNLSGYVINQVSQNLTDRDITAVQQVTLLSGGTDQETLAQVKNNAPLLFRTQNSILNTTDAESVIGAFNEVKTVKAIGFSNNFYFYVLPASGEKADAAFLEMIKERVKDIVVADYEIYGLLTEYVPVGPVELVLYALPGYDVNEITAEAQQLLLDYTDPLADLQYGKGFVRSEITRLLLSNVAGVQNVVYNKVAGIGAHDVNILATEVLEPLNISDIQITVLRAQ